MGRSAGPVVDAWKKQVKARREHKARTAGFARPLAPLVHPSSSRRQMAMLWLIGEYCQCSTGIGYTGGGTPPLTDDMRVLLAKGYLHLARRAAFKKGSSCRRENVLSITPAGKSILERIRISQQDKQYIIAAGQSATLR